MSNINRARMTIARNGNCVILFNKAELLYDFYG